MATASLSSVSGSGFPAAVTLANVCSAEGQKRWLRSYMDETYFWFDQIPDVDAAAYGTALAYYDALLARPSDRFSSTMTSSVANTMQGLLAASDPTAIALAAASNPVPLTRTFTSGTGRKVGYLLFTEHSQGAQDALITAFQGFGSAGVQDLVLDLRYNAGGFLYIAQAVASMVAGDASDGKVFETLRYNRKRDAESANGTLYFTGLVQTAETTHAKDTPLPRLSLPRLYVLTSQLTCSASESIINSLRGIGVEVILVGDRTCGKPFGFHRKDNCGQAFFPIEFQVHNALGFGDYTGGFVAQCKVAENPRTPLGVTHEPLLAAALQHIDTGSCPPAATALAAGVQVRTATASPLERDGAPSAASPMYQPGWNGRQLLR